MTEWRRGCTLALIIDGDNATPKIVKRLLGEIANYKTTSVKCVSYAGIWVTRLIKRRSVASIR